MVAMTKMGNIMKMAPMYLQRKTVTSGKTCSILLLKQTRFTGPAFSGVRTL